MRVMAAILFLFFVVDGVVYDFESTRVIAGQIDSAIRHSRGAVVVGKPW